jgi:hypothetical protein
MDPNPVTRPHLLPEFSLENKVVVISGGARGLGLVQAEALLEAGATGKFCLFQSQSSCLFNSIQLNSFEMKKEKKRGTRQRKRQLKENTVAN